MRRIFYSFAALLGILSLPSLAVAQTFTVVADTVYGHYDNITNITGADIPLDWHVKATNFPADWLVPMAFGICDNNSCYSNASNALWNSVTSTGPVFSATYWANATHDSLGAFGLSLNLTGTTTSGTFFVTVNLLDKTSSYTKDITFFISHTATPSIVNNVGEGEKINIYPNPVSSELAVECSGLLNANEVVISDAMGRVLINRSISGAREIINTDALVPGIYILRVTGEAGVIATERFVKL